MNVNELKVKRGQLVTQMDELRKKAEMTAEDSAKFDAIDAEQESVRVQIEKQGRADALVTEMAATKAPARADINADGAKEDRAGEDAQRSAAFERYFRYGLNALEPEEKRMLSRLYRADSEPYEQRYTPQTVTTTGGGYAIPVGFSGKLEETLKMYGNVAGVADEMVTETGNTINWPTLDDTSNTGELLAINTAAADGSVTFGQVQLLAYKFSSKLILIPNELLQDTGIPIEQSIARWFGERIGRITNSYFTTGNNSGQPQGVVNGAAAGVTGASASAVTFDELLDLIHSVDPAYRPQCRFMFNDATLKALRKLKDGEGRPIWQAGYLTKEPDAIFGYPYTVNPQMADLGSAAVPILFGDFKKYIVRRVRAFSLMRLAERYAEYDQVAFVGFMRADGRVLNSAGIKKFTNAA